MRHVMITPLECDVGEMERLARGPAKSSRHTSHSAKPLPLSAANNKPALLTHVSHCWKPLKNALHGDMRRASHMRAGECDRLGSARVRPSP